MALNQVLRYLNNEDTSSTAYKIFNKTPFDRYPTFSVCLLWTNNHRSQLRTNYYMTNEFGIDISEYNQLLKGKEINRALWGTKIGFSNISNIDHEKFRIKLESFLTQYEFLTDSQDRNNNKYGSILEDKDTMSFYVSYRDPNTICFSRKSEWESGLIRTQDRSWFDLQYLKKSQAHFQIYIHHPGQLIRSLGKPLFEIFLKDLNKREIFDTNHIRK